MDQHSSHELECRSLVWDRQGRESWRSRVQRALSRKVKFSQVNLILFRVDNNCSYDSLPLFQFLGQARIKTLCLKLFWEVLNTIKYRWSSQHWILITVFLLYFHFKVLHKWYLCWQAQDASLGFYDTFPPSITGLLMEFSKVRFLSAL